MAHDPLAIDFDGDNKLDLVALDQEGYLTLRRSGGKAERIFVDEDYQPLRLNNRSSGRSGRAQISLSDWDSDGRLDLLVNSQNAAWYRNVADREGKVVLKSDRQRHRAQRLRTQRLSRLSPVILTKMANLIS